MMNLRGVTGGSVVPVPPCVVPSAMVVKPFGTICEEVIGVERREKFFQVVPNSLRWYPSCGIWGHAHPKKI